MIPTDHQWKLGKYRKKLICWEKFTILIMLTKMTLSSLLIGEGLTSHFWWQILPSLISNQEVFNDIGIKLLMTASFEGPQVPIDFWLCTKMMVRVGMIQGFLFHVLTGGRLVYKVNIPVGLSKGFWWWWFPQNVRTNLDDYDDDEYKRREVSGLLIRTGVTARK